MRRRRLGVLGPPTQACGMPRAQLDRRQDSSARSMQPADSQLPTRVWRTVAQTLHPVRPSGARSDAVSGSRLGKPPEQAAACGIEGDVLKSPEQADITSIEVSPNSGTAHGKRISQPRPLLQVGRTLVSQLRTRAESFCHSAGPRNTRSARSSRMRSPSARRPRWSRTFARGIVVILSIMIWLGCSIPVAAVTSTAIRVSGASRGLVVSGQTVIEAVASNRSS